MQENCDLEILREKQIELKNNCKNLLMQSEEDDSAYLGYTELKCNNMLYGYHCFVLTYDSNETNLIIPKYNLNLNWPSI